MHVMEANPSCGQIPDFFFIKAPSKKLDFGSCKIIQAK